MLLDLNGSVCEVVTGVVVVFPVLQSPGYKIQSIDERTLVYFADSDKKLVEAYVDSGEGIDRAGGFAVQVSLGPFGFVGSGMADVVGAGSWRTTHPQDRRRLPERCRLPRCVVLQVVGDSS